jgi:translation initiation factor IF-2
MDHGEAQEGRSPGTPVPRGCQPAPAPVGDGAGPQDRGRRPFDRGIKVIGVAGPSCYDGQDPIDQGTLRRQPPPRALVPHGLHVSESTAAGAGRGFLAGAAPSPPGPRNRWPKGGALLSQVMPWSSRGTVYGRNSVRAPTFNRGRQFVGGRPVPRSSAPGSGREHTCVFGRPAGRPARGGAQRARAGHAERGAAGRGRAQGPGRAAYRRVGAQTGPGHRRGASGAGGPGPASGAGGPGPAPGAGRPGPGQAD